MASLQSSCTLLSTNVPNRRITPSLSSKPSHLLTKARQSRRFHVSCNGGGADQQKGGKVDRRNMLLGLGGLYGAANLNNANAAPIPAPDFSACETDGAFDTRRGDPLFVNCCPPASSSDPFDYVPPPVPLARVRRAAQNVKDDREYVAKYNEGIRRMKYLDVVDPDDPRGFKQQANIHCAYCNGPHNQPGYDSVDIKVHANWLFFPFHRWYLYFFERILGSLIEDPTFALPFWNWDNPPGMLMPEIFDNPCSSLYDPKRNQANRRPAIVNLSIGDVPEDERIENNLSVINAQQRVPREDILLFMGQPYRAGNTEMPGMGTGESGAHNMVHRWVGDPREKYGENLGNFYSAGRDPIFYSHHANVDRMWTLWPVSDPQEQVHIQDPDYLDSAFLFYDENKRLVRVKVRDCLNYRSLGYVYEQVPTPWKDLNLGRTTATAQLADLSKGVETADKLVPLTLTNTVKVLVPKTSKGKASELLVLEDMVVDHTQFVHFDVFINDDLGDYTKLNRGEFAGTYSHLPHATHANTDEEKSIIRFDLTSVYHNINIADADDSIVVTIVPKSNGKNVTIGGIKIVKSNA